MKRTLKMSNLDLWEKVCETNPNHTKQVNFGRKITAIDPYRQVMNATAEFGPVGDGWGWKVVDTVFLPTNEVAVLVEMWHGDSGRAFQQWGQNSLYIDKAEQKKDTDCMKKATTDGITKCLSFLGFNADIFLGKFDDSKYVQAMQKKADEKPWHGPLKVTELKEELRKLSSALDTCSKPEKLDEIIIKFEPAMAQAKVDLETWYGPAKKRLDEIVEVSDLTRAGKADMHDVADEAKDHE